MAPCATCDFKTISEVQEKFRIMYAEDDFVGAEPSSPSAEFLRDFEFTREHINVFASEAARCEAIIFPVLKESYKAYADQYALWIKQSIAYDEVLNGTPDYFISTRSELGKTVVGSPLILLVEAKKNDFEQGWGQCLAELVAAQKINAKNIDGSARFPRLWHCHRRNVVAIRTGLSVIHLPKTEQTSHWLICRRCLGQLIPSSKPPLICNRCVRMVDG